MAKAKRKFVCQQCGTVTSRWQGQCEDCGDWNSIVEEVGETVFSARHDLQSGGRAISLVALDSEVALPPRTSTGIAEFDRALGGGIVSGSATLIGGDPGIGKSTLLLQAAARIAARGLSVAYISGEEAADQVRLRAQRLGLGGAPVQLASATSVRDILTTLGEGPPPALLVIDSIQTMHSDLIEGAPGTVSQVRASAQELIKFAKQRGTAIIMVGHVTKDGSIAGPRVLEHMVDTVLAFEGERSHQYRILRAMILAVLEARCGLSFSTAEVYLNVAGGYRLSDPAADLAVAAALISALSERPVPADVVLFGEVALSSEIRPVAHAPLRLREAAKLGFNRAFIPAAAADGVKGIAVSGFRTLAQLVDQMLGRG